MDIHLTPRFQRSFSKLTKGEMQATRKALALLTDSPSLQVKKMQGRNIWETRASIGLRITFDIICSAKYMRHVGNHDKVLKNP
jgi:hypothetical protein